MGVRTAITTTVTASARVVTSSATALSHGADALAHLSAAGEAHAALYHRSTVRALAAQEQNVVRRKQREMAMREAEHMLDLEERLTENPRLTQLYNDLVKDLEAADQRALHQLNPKSSAIAAE